MKAKETQLYFNNSIVVLTHFSCFSRPWYSCFLLTVSHILLDSMSHCLLSYCEWYYSLLVVTCSLECLQPQSLSWLVGWYDVTRSSSPGATSGQGFLPVLQACKQKLFYANFASFSNVSVINAVVFSEVIQHCCSAFEFTEYPSFCKDIYGTHYLSIKGQR